MKDELREQYLQYLEEVGLTEEDYSFFEYKRDMYEEIEYNFYN